MFSRQLAQLAAFCRTQAHAPKVVFVPSAQAGQQLAAGLAAAGEAWGNLRLVTPAEWAAHWAGPQLAAAGWQPLGADEEFFLVGEALSSAGRARALGSTDRPTPGLVRGLVQTLRALRLNGVGPAALRDLGAGGEGRRALADLYDQYLQTLEQRRRYDLARLFVAATELEGPRRGAFGILAEVMLPELPSRFVRHCLGPDSSCFTWDTAVAGPPAQSAGARFAGLPSPPAHDHPGQGELRIQTWEVAGSEAEVRAVLRAVLQDGQPLDQVELVYTVDQPYLALVHALSEQWGMEIESSQGFPPGLSPVGLALFGFFRWVGSGFEATELAELCRAGLICGPPPSGSLQHLAPFLRPVRVRGNEEEHDGIPPSEDPDKAALTLQAQALWNSLRSLVPAAGETSLGALAEAGIALLAQWVPMPREHDRKVAELLGERLRSLGAVPGSDSPARLVPRLLDRLAAPLFPAGSGPAAGRLLVSPLERAGYAGRKAIYIIGMDEGAFPGKPGEDPLLGDAERRELGLPQQRERPAGQVWHLSRLLACSRGSITLVSKRCELQDGRELSPAPLLLHLAEHGDRIEVPLVVDDPALALDEAEALLCACRGRGGAPQARGLFPWLEEGEHAWRQREQKGWGRFSGWLGGPTPELGLRGSHQPRSASSLETLMRCPYRYFLRYVLELGAPQDQGEDSGCWLSPIEFGAALHQLFFRFLSALRDRGESPALDLHRPLLEQMLRELVAELRLRIPVHHEAALRADLRRLERAALVFLRVESRIPEVERLEFELAFGLGEHDGARSGGEVVLKLSDDLQIPLQGRIDRVDRLGTGYQIWDYKTGASTPYEGEDLLRGGIHLQWALYAYALEEILREREHGAEVTGAGYFFVGAREHGRRLSAAPPERTQVARYLAPVLGLMEQGAFFHLQKERQCLYCDFASLCGGEERLPGEVSQESLPDLPGLADLLRQWADG